MKFSYNLIGIVIPPITPVGDTDIEKDGGLVIGGSLNVIVGGKVGVGMESLPPYNLAFSTIAALLRIHLIAHLDLMWVVTEGRRAYAKRPKGRNKSPTAVQLSLF